MEFSLNIDNRAVEMNKRYYEFTQNLEKLNTYFASYDFYLEAVNDQNQTMMGSMRNSVKNFGLFRDSRKTSKEALQTYGNVTTSGGLIAKSIWNIMMKGFSLSNKILVYVTDKIARIPEFVGSITNNIASIPDEVRRKIRGDIKLYIPLQDLEIFQKRVFPYILNFYDAAEEIGEGNMFGTFFKRRPVSEKGLGKFILTENDIKYANIMKDCYEKLKNVQFSKTIVEITNDAVALLYFGNDKSYTYKNAEGKTVKGNYYSALVEVFEILRDRNNWLKELKDAFKKKLDETLINRAIEKLNKEQQELIRDTLTVMVKFITMIGNLVKYVVADLNTLSGSIDKILKKK